MLQELELLINGQQFRKLCEKKYEAAMEEYGLRKIDLDILYFLSRSGQHNTAKDIVHLRHVSKAHISGAIDHLVQKGYTRALMDEKDRRCNHIVLTEDAGPVIGRIAKIKQEIAGIVYRGITEEESRVLVQVAKKMMENIEQELEQDSREGN